MTTAITDIAASAGTTKKLLTIGAVCRRLKDDFRDISISKIRYLEDQGLLAPRRTPGGYRLFSEEDIARLETILRLQRDEFLPLRVIRQELSSQLALSRRKRRGHDFPADDGELGLAELCERAGITRELARDLEEYGVLTPNGRAGEGLYSEDDVDVALACGRLAAYGISARHLRTFRTTADRAAALLDQVVAPALKSRNPDRQRSAIEDLVSLGEVAQELTQLLLWKALRRVAAA